VVFRIEPPWQVDLAGSVDSVAARIAADRARVDRQFEDFFRRLSSLPGATAVGAVSRLPLTGEYWITSVDRADRPAPTPDRRIAAYVRPATSGYLAAIGTPIRRGRGILPTDRHDAERIAVIDELLARAAFADEDPIGRELLVDGPPGRPRPRVRVVGVVAPVLMAGLDGGSRPTFYLPFGQAGEGHSNNWGMDVVVRGPGIGEVASAATALAREVFPEAPVFGIRQVEDLTAASLSDRRLHLTLLGTFAGTALLLATLGVGGLLLLLVDRRRRDLAIRMALGAAPRMVWWEVQRWALAVAGAGTTIGLMAAILVARGLQSLVFEISASDPIVLGVAAAIGLLGGFGAALLPAHRAISLQPTDVLRQE
jgi:hypothetical protein